MTRRRITGAVLATAATTLAVASTAYACVVLKGDATVTGAKETSNLMTGLGTPRSHGYCAGRAPVTAAAGQPGTDVSATFATATACTDVNNPNRLSMGTYDVRLRNTTAGFTGADGTGWSQVPGSGCFATGNAGLPNNSDLGNLMVDATGSGSGNWRLPSTLVPNGPMDASVFCVGKFGDGGEAPTGASDGFLAPFRVALI